MSTFDTRKTRAPEDERWQQCPAEQSNASEYADLVDALALGHISHSEFVKHAQEHFGMDYHYALYAADEISPRKPEQ